MNKDDDTIMTCEYGNCDVELPRDQMEHRINGELIFVCPTCIDKVEDKTGYCSLTCCLGYGCDGSC